MVDDGWVDQLDGSFIPLFVCRVSKIGNGHVFLPREWGGNS